MDSLRASGLITARPSLFGLRRGTYETLITIIGSVLRLNSATEKNALLSALRAGEATLTLSSRSGLKSPIPQTSSRERLSGDGRDESITPVVDIGYYTVILKEHGDHIGVIPDYEVETLSLVPPQFRVTVTFKGSRFEGWGSSKKEARHKASKQACRCLRLNPR